MNIKIELVEKHGDELFFDIIDTDLNIKVGFLFTVGEHIAYEVKKEFRGMGIATTALREITRRLKRPVLEITHDNIASKKVAEKVGYVLVRENKILEYYTIPSKSTSVKKR